VLSKRQPKTVEGEMIEKTTHNTKARADGVHHQDQQNTDEARKLQTFPFRFDILQYDDDNGPDMYRLDGDDPDHFGFFLPPERNVISSCESWFR
jgi:hypothetical protein